MSFKDKVAIVTGAGHGIGEATAKLLAERGATVVCNSQSNSCKRVADEITTSGGKAIHFIADITDVDAAKNMVEETVKKFGRLDILINNAGWWGVPRHQNIEDVKKEDWDRVLDVNLTGHFNCVKFTVPYMKKQGYGKIVNVSSGAGVVWSRTGIHAYTASKAGLGGFTRQLAKELAAQNINVNCIAPGLIYTRPERIIRLQDMTPEEEAEHEKFINSIPAKRVGVPKDIANVIIFMASDEACYIHGQTLLVDGGYWMK
jgi:NAD(P)-dependent dehydrogenase (short-subunit alcohol dehydrogenase family)